MLVCGVYITWPKQLKLWKIPAVVGSIVVVGVLIMCIVTFYMEFESCTDEHAM